MVLESGPYVDHTSYPTDPLEGLPLLYRDGGMTIASGKPAIPIPVGRTVGGTTVINSGTCFRAPREVLDGVARGRRGRRGPASSGASIRGAEKVLAVTPLDLETLGRNGQLCAEGAAALGASGGPISRNAGTCVQCSSCPLGCRIDAKRATHVSYLPRAVAAGARVRAGVQVQRILIEDGRAAGLACRAGMPTTAAQEAARNGRAPSGRDWEVRAKAVISAGGAFGTPELLLRSRIGHPALGRHLHVHPAAWIGARYEEEVRGWEGVMQSYYVDEWPPEGILLEATFTPLSFGAQWLPGVGAGLRGSRRELRPHRLDRRPPPRPLRGARRASAPTARCGSPTGCSRRRRGRSSSGSRAPPRSTSPPARPRSIRTSARCSVIPRGKLAEFEALTLRPVGPAPRGLPPDEQRADGLRPGDERLRPARRGARGREPLRRGREPAADLGRGQPDDDRSSPAPPTWRGTWVRR